MPALRRSASILACGFPELPGSEVPTGLFKPALTPCFCIGRLQTGINEMKVPPSPLALIFLQAGVLPVTFPPLYAG